MLVKPEEVGLSSARLGRINDHLRSYIDAGKLSGTLTLVYAARDTEHNDAVVLAQVLRRGLPTARRQA